MIEQYERQHGEIIHSSTEPLQQHNRQFMMRDLPEFLPNSVCRGDFLRQRIITRHTQCPLLIRKTHELLAICYIAAVHK